MWFWILSFLGMQSVEAARVKDISDVYGVRDNSLRLWFGDGFKANRR